MKILLIGGGSGGHITPLLAVAHELKQLVPECELIGVCERGSRFVHLFSDSPVIDGIRQVPAGKYRRYAGLSLLKKALDIKTLALNGRDVFRTLRGYRQAIQLLKLEKPDALLIKGGFVAVPMGLAAAKLKVPFVTHDSDSTPGLANRIISRWAARHATGMPSELYSFASGHVEYTGIPVSNNFHKITPGIRRRFREKVGLNECSEVITIIGGSQGGEQLNKDIVTISGKLLEKRPNVGIIHIAGSQKVSSTQTAYEHALMPQDLKRVVLRGFVNDPEVYTGAADVVVSRASATILAELSLQGLPTILVPGRLSDGHQDKNAAFYAEKGAATIVPYGESESLLTSLEKLLDDEAGRNALGENILQLAKPHAARELAELTLHVAKGE